MKYKLLMPILLLLFIIPQAQVNAEEDTQIIKHIVYTILTPKISQAIDQYYSDKTQRSFGLYDVEILEIERLEEGGYEFLLTLQVPTYIGAHNPPYGLEIITFIINPAKVEVINYLHKGGQ